MKITMKLALQLLLGATPALAQNAAHPGPGNGERLYRYWCATCHGVGPGHPGTQALAKLYAGDIPDALELRTDLDPDAIRYFVRNGSSIMPFFRKTELTDAEITAITGWLTRNNPK